MQMPPSQTIEACDKSQMVGVRISKYLDQRSTKYSKDDISPSSSEQNKRSKMALYKSKLMTKVKSSPTVN